MGAIQSHLQRPTRPHVSRNPSYFRFLDLPPEIKNMIYEEVLVVGKVFYNPRAACHHRERLHQHYGFQKPVLDLLRVCKQIHQEAEPVYLGNNLFDLPVDFYKYRPFCQFKYGFCSECHNDFPYLFSRAGFKFIKYIRISFDTTPNRSFGYRELQVEYDAKNGAASFAGLSSQARKRAIDSWHDNYMGIHYYEVPRNLRFFSRDMEYVEFDITELYGVRGCGRMINPCIHKCIDWLRPTKVTITGLLNDDKAAISYEDVEDTTVNFTMIYIKLGLYPYTTWVDKETQERKWDRYRVARK